MSNGILVPPVVLERLSPVFRVIARFSAYIEVEALLALPSTAFYGIYHRHHLVDGERGEFMTLLWSTFPQCGRDVMLPTALCQDYVTLRQERMAHAIYGLEDPEAGGLFYEDGRRIAPERYLEEIERATPAPDSPSFSCH